MSWPAWEDPDGISTTQGMTRDIPLRPWLRLSFRRDSMVMKLMQRRTQRWQHYLKKEITRLDGSRRRWRGSRKVMILLGRHRKNVRLGRKLEPRKRREL